MTISRRIRVGGVTLIAFMLTAASCDSEQARTERPDLAVAMGDSFVSGEGAQDFIIGDGAADYNGTAPSSLFTTSNDDPYFCHVSGNSSIFTSNIPGIDAELNLACSGADPEDIERWNPDHEAFDANGFRTAVRPQIDQLVDLLPDNDVEVILVGFGANNSITNFGEVLGFCHAAFMIDASGGISANGLNMTVSINGAETTIDIDGAEEQFAMEFSGSQFPDPNVVMEENGCDPGDFYGETELATITAAYVEGLERIVATMQLSGYVPGSFKLVVQGYGSPYAPVPHADFLRDNGKQDDRARFAGLARERYAAGCPMHVRSMEEAENMAALLSSIGQDAAAATRLTLPTYANDIIYLDVQRAFDGGRLCENADSPANALWNPIWFRDASGELQRIIPERPLQPFVRTWINVARPCTADDGFYQLCQDSAHPNEAGHIVLGTCLREAVATSGTRELECRREPSTGSITVGAL